MERTGPTYRRITNANGQSGTDTVTPAANSTTTYIYTVYDSTGGPAQKAGSCSAKVTTNSKGTISCTATPGNAYPNLNQGDTIKVTLTNNSTQNLKGDQLRQTSPGGGTWNLGNFTQGQSASKTFTINPRSTAQTVTFEYNLFDGPGAGAGHVGNVPLCTTQITWGGTPPPAGITIAPACGTTNIFSTGSPPTKATYVHTVTTNPPYQTNTTPDNFPLRPYVWATPPPPVAGGRYTYTGPGAYQTQVTLPADEIPVHLTFRGTDGSTNTADVKLQQSNGYSISIDTFNQWGFLWPHIGYSITLQAQTTGSLGSEENGPYSYNYSTASSLDGNCLQYSSCVGPSSDPGPVEPGQPYTFQYQVNLVNLTNKTFGTSSTGGYYFEAHTSGGLDYTGGTPASADSISPGNPTGVRITIPTIVNYTGQFSVDFWYKGSVMDSLEGNSWDGECGAGTGQAGTDTPATRPYFQVWDGDTSAGGAFKSPSGSCAGSGDPPYVSPAVSGNQYSGGIRAFANQSDNRGSLTDFGAIAMGLIPGSSGGPTGFFSAHGIIFANVGVPSGNLGGYLNSNSTGHCVDDYFTNTRIDPNPPGISGGSWSSAASGQYTLSGGTLDGGNLPAGKQITIYVDGDLTIDGNINYPSTFDPNGKTSVPYLAVIVRGDITLTSNVTHLDGLYVAQPNGSSGGVFATCDSTCNDQLVVDGAVIAQHVELLRSHGTLGPLQKDENGIGTNPAEIFDYVPSMVIGTPEFAPLYNSPESLFSLPPVF